MNEIKNTKQYDLESRTFSFAKNVRMFVKKIPRTEANESLGKKDFMMRIKISRKESKESKFWLLLIDVNESDDLEKERGELAKEADELMMIFGSIFRKSE